MSSLDWSLSKRRSFCFSVEETKRKRGLTWRFSGTFFVEKFSFKDLSFQFKHCVSVSYKRENERNENLSLFVNRYFTAVESCGLNIGLSATSPCSIISDMRGA